MDGDQEKSGASKQAQILELARRIGAAPEDLDRAREALQAEMRSTTHKRLAAANPVVQPATPQNVVPVPVELTSEALVACLERLEGDFKRGIVLVDERSSVDQYRVALERDKTAGTKWETLETRLKANDGALLKRAARMQGGGELIGVDASGNLIMISRANSQGNREPERFIFRRDQLEGEGDNRRPRTGEKPVLVNTDTPNREELMAESLPADYWEIRNAVNGDGYALPPDSPKYKKEGLVAAAEAVTGHDFVCSQDEYRFISAILECGDVPRSADVRVVYFRSNRVHARVVNVFPEFRYGSRGVVRVLRG